MKGRGVLISILTVGLLALLVGLTAAQGPEPAGRLSPRDALDTAFTYQGRLKHGTTPADGSYDFVFNLYDAATDPSTLLGTVTAEDASVTDGLFSVELDFGAGVFSGDARWLEIGMRPGDSVDPHTVLTPRRELTAAPYALYAPSAGSAPWSGLSGVLAGFADNTDDDTDTLGGLPCLNGQVTKWDGSAWVCATDLVGGGDGGAYWSLTGNAGTTPGVNLLGTTDNQALELHVSSDRALRLEPAGNLIGGHSDNRVTDGVVGATISGGGGSGGANQVTDVYGTVGGGLNNQAGSKDTIIFNAKGATVGGGEGNTASGRASTIPGGLSNSADGDYSFAAGRRAEANHQGAFVWADSTDADFASSGDDQFLVRASGGVVFTSTVGALLRMESNTTSPNLIGGYSGNSVTAGAYGATIGGGGATLTNRVTDNYGTVGGGRGNRAGDDDGDTTNASWATVGGGDWNEASDRYATVGGGYDNAASGHAAIVGGGYDNAASGFRATVGGGYDNAASDSYATVGGGSNNAASGLFATVSGGQDNTASGDYGFAAGRRAKANHEGTFVWADSTDADFASSGDNQFLVRASGGVSFTTGSAPFEVNGNPVQARVSGTCAVGSTIRAVNADGTVVCQTDAPLNRSAAPAANFLRLFDYADNVGEYNSITIGTDGLGLISYRDVGGTGLGVVHCANPFCVPYFRRR